ncbi:SdpA family antimicrobial peptide system protein [Streptosporangium sp. NPDC002524]|uniref:SdpA family antimicrobial peptide system protein n=1 Tax=Streptosporangium sp. NPDC002524 TaxID=3154537 RepID=UPI00332DD5F1
MRPRSPTAGLGARVLALALIWAVIIGYAVHTQLPANAVRLPGQDELHTDIRRITPQGWAFFTRSAREPRTEIWRFSTHGWQPSTDAARRLGGWDRGHRWAAGEKELLAGAVPDGHWQACAIELVSCFATGRRWTVANPTAEPTLCGVLGLARREPVPWAWADDEITMPVSTAVVTATC